MMSCTDSLYIIDRHKNLLGSLRSMAVLSSRAQEQRSRKIRRPNLLAVSLPSPAFIT